MTLTTKKSDSKSQPVQYFGDDLSFEYLDKNSDMLIPSHEINEIESHYMDPIIYYEEPYLTYRERQKDEYQNGKKQKWTTNKYYSKPKLEFKDHFLYSKRKNRDRISKR